MKTKFRNKRFRQFMSLFFGNGINMVERISLIKQQSVAIGCWSEADLAVTNDLLEGAIIDHYEPNSQVCVYAVRQDLEENVYQLMMVCLFARAEAIEFTMRAINDREVKVAGVIFAYQDIESLVRGVLARIPDLIPECRALSFTDYEIIPIQRLI